LIDVCQWILDAQAPLSATAMGGKLGCPDDAMETPDTMQVIWEYPGFNMIWEHAIGIGRGPEGCEHGVEVHGNDGVLIMDPMGWRVVSETRNRRKQSVGSSVAQRAMDKGPMLHQENFVNCIRTRRRPNSEIETAHRSMIVCHLGNIAYRVGRRVVWGR
jgi:predicted dehydrogenase